jgi:hypothetical protein
MAVKKKQKRRIVAGLRDRRLLFAGALAIGVLASVIALRLRAAD